MAEPAPTNLPAARIGAEDLIALSVYDAPELTRTVRIDARGEFALPLLKARVKAAGLLPSELESRVSAMLEEEGILVRPVVAVTIAEFHSRPVSVMGAVRKPLTFQASGRITLLDALARAEGLTQDAAPSLTLTRPKDAAQSTSDRERIEIPVRELIDAARPELNYLLTGGEEIRVPEARKVYVVGNVRKPGAYPVRDGTPVTVLKALALAEGLGPFTEKQAYIYRPEPGGETRKEIPVEIDRLVRRKAPDVELRADDVLYIPENRGRRTTVSVLEKTAAFGLTTASGVLVWRR